jgi:DNA-binding MarR family transcriptional regulator
MEDLLNPRHCVSNTLHQTARAVNRVYSEEMRPLGVTRSQYSILAYLNAKAPIQVSRLATLLYMDRTTLSRNLKPLEKSGLLKVCPSETDRRAKELLLTRAGKAKYREATRAWRRAQKHILESFGENNWADLEISLKRLRES